MLGGTVLLCALAGLVSTAKKHSVNFRERRLGDLGLIHLPWHFESVLK